MDDNLEKVKKIAKEVADFQSRESANSEVPIRVSKPENHGQGTRKGVLAGSEFGRGLDIPEARVKIPLPPTVFDWRYGEGDILVDLETHMKSTYTSHYTSENLEKIQTIDVFAHRGTLGSTSIDNAIKYLMRYGKKNGKNEKDLIKALHYLILATAFERKMKLQENG